MKSTRYRERFANGGLKKELDRLNNSCELYMLVAQYLEISHEESRVFRLINASVIIKDLKCIIRYCKKMMKQDISIYELMNYKAILEQLEKELSKKQRKSEGGYKADATKKIVEEKISDWIELDYSPFSYNYMYSYIYGKQVRSKSYEKWRNNFPVDDVPTLWEMFTKYGIRVQRKIALDIEVITVEGMDIDNCIKSFQDTLVEKCWGLVNDYNIVAINIKRIGVADSYENCLIRFRVKQVD